MPLLSATPNLLKYYREDELPDIEKAYQAMLASVRSEIKPEDQLNLDRAFCLAVEAHGPQRRKSGEPYIYHPIEVARICAAEFGLGPTAIVSALLHDVVEDTPITLQEIKLQFGEKIAMIVDGLTKIESIANSQQEDTESSSPQAENFKKILLTISKDVRVVLVKMADRLHNMRTLGAMSESKQKKIASETSFIYAPLAHRLGFYKIKTELEDLSMLRHNPDQYHFIVQKLQETKDSREAYVESFIAPIRKQLEEDGLKFKIFGRSKSISSIASKLNKKHIPFEEIYDLFAVRVILDVKPEREKSACWHVYSIITDNYTPVPERLKDWVSVPKSNGYESLHTTVMGPKGRFVEVQIRSERMDEIAEMGFAAHWKYKGVSSQENIFENWLSKARELLENPSNDAIDFLNDFRSNLFAEEVYVFTPKGDMRIFPKGATALDFAFDIHSEVGYRCKAVKVAQRIVPISYELKNGDQISVVTNNNQKPTEDWLKIVKTGKARSKIRHALREEKLRLGGMGKETLERKLKGWKIPFSEENIDTLTRFFDAKSRLDFYCNIYKEQYNLSDLKTALDLDHSGKLVPIAEQRSQQSRIESNEAIPTIRPLVSGPTEIKQAFKGKPRLMIDDQDAAQYVHEMASCCNPIPGDRIFAYITTQNMMRIHRMDCPNSEHLHATYGYRILRAQWVDSEAQLDFDAELLITGMDNIGVVQRLSDIITNQKKANMKAFSMAGEEGHFEGRIRVVVANRQQLEDIIEAIRSLEEVQTVIRVS